MPAYIKKLAKPIPAASMDYALGVIRETNYVILKDVEGEDVSKFIVLQVSPSYQEIRKNLIGMKAYDRKIIKDELMLSRRTYPRLYKELEDRLIRK